MADDSSRALYTNGGGGDGGGGSGDSTDQKFAGAALPRGHHLQATGGQEGTEKLEESIPLQEKLWTEDEKIGDSGKESSKWIKDMTYDDLLTSLGELGWRQKIVCVLVSIQCINLGIQLVSSVFIMAVVSHRCAIPGMANDTWEIQSERHALLVNLTIPPGVLGKPYSSCHIYTDLWSGNRTVNVSSSHYGPNHYYDGGNSGRESHRNGSGVGNDSSMTTPTTAACHRYVYDTSSYESSIAMDLKLVCGRSLYRSHAQMMIMLGCLVGSQVAGLVSDTWGRKMSMMMLNMVNIVSMFCLVFVGHYVALLFVVFLVGMSTMGALGPSFIICLEILGPSKRTIWLAVWSGVGFGLGLLVMALLAYFLRQWTHLQLAYAACTLVYLAFWWLVPESPRWLLNKGRVEKAKVILAQIARSNKTTFDPRVLERVQVNSDPEVSLWRVLFRAKKLIGRHLIIFFSWFVASFSFYGVSYNVGSLGGDVYLNMVIGAVMDIVAILLCAPLMKRFGRRPLTSVFFLITGVVCVATLFPVIFASKDQQWITVVLALIGKCSMAVNFAIIWLYSPELFPTVMRNSCQGAASLCARAGGLLAPYVANMALGGAAGRAIPLVIFGVPAIVVSVLTLFLPETLNRSLPDTLEDAVHMGRLTAHTSAPDMKHMNIHKKRAYPRMDPRVPTQGWRGEAGGMKGAGGGGGCTGCTCIPSSASQKGT